MKKTIYSKSYVTLTERLKKAREDAGLTQIDVARQLGKPQSFISKIESGQYRVDVIQLILIAEIYGKKLDHFVSEYDSPVNFEN
jgi:transcriptional regulator with XRE-family HTH domain